jgi:hypothetical protein
MAVWNSNGVYNGIMSKSLRYIGSTGDSTTTDLSSYTVSYLPAARSGDLAIAMFALEQNTPTLATPSGWTLVGNGDNVDYPRMYVFVKVLNSTDISTGSLTATPSVSEGFAAMISIFRSYKSISSLTPRNFVNDAGVDALSVSLTTSGATPLTIAVAFLSGRPNQSPVLTFSGATTVTDSSTSGTRSLGFIVYDVGETPAAATITGTDTGRQSLSAFYLDIGQ